MLEIFYFYNRFKGKINFLVLADDKLSVKSTNKNGSFKIEVTNKELSITEKIEPYLWIEHTCNANPVMFKNYWMMLIVYSLRNNLLNIH